MGRRAHVNPQTLWTEAPNALAPGVPLDDLFGSVTTVPNIAAEV
jgi:hypothetical protein